MGNLKSDQMDVPQGATPISDRDRLAADAMMRRVRVQMMSLRETDPQSWAEYLQEGQAWEEGMAEPVDV